MTRGTQEPERRSRILIGVTARSSVGLLAGMPERLDEEGWEVHLVSAPAVGGTGSPRFQASVPAAIHVHDLPMERDPSPHRDVASLFQWLRLLRRVRPDVVYVGTPKAGLLGIVASRLMRVPTRIYIARGLRAETARGVKRRILVLAEKVTMRLA